MTVRRRLIRSTAFIASAAVLVLGIPLVVVETARVGADQSYRLEREADVVAGLIDDRIEAGQPITAAELAPHVVAGHRISVRLDGRTVTAGALLHGAVRSVRASSARNASVFAAAPRSEESGRILRVWLLIVLFGLGGVGLAVALAAFQARRLSGPLERVARTSRQLGEGDFSARAPRSGVPEIDAIASALDHSAEQIARLVAREREFSSNVSHQMRTPLTALRLRVEELSLPQTDADREQEAAAALREADRLESTIEHLLAYAREERAGRAVPLDLARVAADHVAVWAPLLRRESREIVLRADADVVGFVSRGTAGQVLDVLIENALRHGRGDVTVTVTAEGHRVLLSVEDEGPGVRGSTPEAAFARGSSSTVSSTGIGLHLARALAEADGASLIVSRSRPARLELRLPRTDLSGPTGAPARVASLPG